MTPRERKTARDKKRHELRRKAKATRARRLLYESREKFRLKYEAIADKANKNAASAQRQAWAAEDKFSKVVQVIKHLNPDFPIGERYMAPDYMTQNPALQRRALKGYHLLGKEVFDAWFCEVRAWADEEATFNSLQKSIWFEIRDRSPGGKAFNARYLLSVDAMRSEVPFQEIFRDLMHQIYRDLTDCLRKDGKFAMKHPD